MIFMVYNKISAKNWEIHLNMFSSTCYVVWRTQTIVESCIVAALFRLVGVYGASMDIFLLILLLSARIKRCSNGNKHTVKAYNQNVRL